MLKSNFKRYFLKIHGADKNVHGSIVRQAGNRKSEVGTSSIGGEKKMEATKKNADTVNAILKILKEEEYTVQEAYSILDFVKGRIKYTSKVGTDNLIFSE